MAVTFGAAGTGNASSNSSFALTPPTRAAGDLLVAVTSSRSRTSLIIVLTGTGWTERAQYTHTDASGLNNIQIWTREATNDTNDNVTFDNDPGETGCTVIGFIFAVSGADNSNPIPGSYYAGNDSGATSASNIGPCASITAAVTGGLAVLVGHKADDASGTPDVSTPTDWNFTQTRDSASGNDALLTAFHRTTTSSTSYGGETLTVNGTTGSVPWASLIFVIAPAATGTQIDVTDSGSGTDATPSMSVQFGLSEAGSGTDTFGAAASFTRTDTVSGSDVLNILAQFMLAETGSLQDIVNQVAVLAAASDAMTASDAIAALTAFAVVSDQGTTSEGTAVAVAVTLSDTWNGSDAVNIITATLVSVLESGSFADLLNIQVSPIQIVDANAVSEGVAISTVTAVYDISTGSDAGITLLVSCPVTDAASGQEGTQVQVSVLIPDGVSGSEVIALILDTIKQILEVAHGIEDIAVSAEATVTDALTAADLTTIQVSLNLSESGSLSEILLVSCLLALSDMASSVDNVGLQVRVQVADSVQGMSVLSGISNLFQVSDLASAVDVSIGFDSELKVVTISFRMRSRSMTFTALQRSMDFSLKSKAITFTLQGEQEDE